MATDEMLLNWLPAVPGLEQAAVDAARQLFSKHSVNDALLDFFASQDGALILDDWRRKLTSMAIESGEDSVDETVAAGPILAASPATPKKLKNNAALRGRQQITRHERQQEGHYFAAHKSADFVHKEIATPRAAGKNAAEKTAESAKMVPSPEAERSVQSTGSCPKRDHRSQEVRCGVPAAVSERHIGTVKSYSKDTGYGFIRCPELGDVYLRDAELQPGVTRPEVGQPIQFSVVFNSRGQPQAREVIWHKVDQPQEFDALRRFEGCLKSSGDDYGFLECAEARELFQRDVYISNDLLPVAGCSLRQPLSFGIVLNARNQPQARNVVWGVPPSEAVPPPKLAQSSGPVSRW